MTMEMKILGMITNKTTVMTIMISTEKTIIVRKIIVMIIVMIFLTIVTILHPWTS